MQSLKYLTFITAFSILGCINAISQETYFGLGVGAGWSDNRFAVDESEAMQYESSPQMAWHIGCYFSKPIRKQTHVGFSVSIHKLRSISQYKIDSNDGMTHQKIAAVDLSYISLGLFSERKINDFKVISGLEPRILMYASYNITSVTQDESFTLLSEIHKKFPDNISKWDLGLLARVSYSILPLIDLNVSMYHSIKNNYSPNGHLIPFEVTLGVRAVFKQ